MRYEKYFFETVGEISAFSALCHVNTMNITPFFAVFFWLSGDNYTQSYRSEFRERYVNESRVTRHIEMNSDCKMMLNNWKEERSFF